MSNEKPVLAAVLKALYFGSLVGASAGAWLVRLSPEEALAYGTQVSKAAEFLRSNSAVVVSLPIVAGGAKYALERLTRSWVRQIIHSLLTDYREKMFGNLPGAKHHHRATLFVHRRFSLWKTLPWKRKRHPWSGWLVPIVRSGHATQKMRTKFLAPDEADLKEGVAGMTWSNRAIVTVIELPNLDSRSNDAEIQRYSLATACQDHWVRNRIKRGESLPSSLRGIPIEVNNNFWGVVVLDSRESNAFTEDPHGTANFSLIFSSTIGRLLERARI